MVIYLISSMECEISYLTRGVPNSFFFLFYNNSTIHFVLIPNRFIKVGWVTNISSIIANVMR